MGIFVYRCLGSGDIRIDIDLTVIDKAVSLTLPATEEHRLALCHILTHLLGDNDRMPRLTVIHRQRHILSLHIPTLRVLVHEVHEHLVIEALHAVGTDNHFLAVETLTLHSGLDFVGHRLANHLGELLTLVTFGIAERDMAVRLHKEINMTHIDLQVNEGTALVALQLLDLVFIEDNLLRTHIMGDHIPDVLTPQVGEHLAVEVFAVLGMDHTVGRDLETLTIIGRIGIHPDLITVDGIVL